MHFLISLIVSYIFTLLGLLSLGSFLKPDAITATLTSRYGHIALFIISLQYAIVLRYNLLVSVAKDMSRRSHIASVAALVFIFIFFSFLYFF